MKKKGLMVLALLVLVAGWSFAQTDFGAMAKNTLTLDFGPTVVGLGIGGIGQMINEETGTDAASSFGFGFGAQYELQLLQHLSVAGRFAYMSGTIGIENETGGGQKAVAKTTLSSFSLEGHARYYPLGETFFLDGMLGYARLSLGISGEVIDKGGGTEKVVEASRTVSRDYFKLGAKVGWRMSFGNNGGFTFESAIGWYGGIASGDTIGRRLMKSLNGDGGEGSADIDISEFDEAFETLENWIFVGGPRLTLAFGFRF